MAEPEQQGKLVPMKQLHTVDRCVQGEHRQDAACLQVPQAQLSWMIRETRGYCGTYSCVLTSDFKCVLMIQVTVQKSASP